MKFKEYKQVNFAEVGREVLEQWKQGKAFEKSIEVREGQPTFTFYEGPPSANGMPGIHHVMSRTVKDIVCRYKTLKGFQVNRKGGWDTHGLPVELQVEKKLGIKKEDIGEKISVEDYNKACRESVMEFTNYWDKVTEDMGYWVDLKDPYVTYENNYIESLWYLLSELHKKGMLYKGYTIQPFSPAAGTGLSSHELNQPGCYKDVKDTTVTAQFKIKNTVNEYILAWTTTPWTLPSNSALAVGEKIDYVKVSTFNQYTHLPVSVILAKELVLKYFPETKWFEIKGTEVFDLEYDRRERFDLITGNRYNEDQFQLFFKIYATRALAVNSFEENLKQQGFEFSSEEIDLLIKAEINDHSKKKSYIILSEMKGSELVGLEYEQLMPYVSPANAFRVIPGDYVTTSDGTGIVHIAPTFGADDKRVADMAGIPAVTVTDILGNEVPLVNKQGCFVAEVTDFAGQPVKEEFYDEIPEGYKNVDIQIAIMLKERNLAFDVKKYEHSYPHCWRTDKPILYYPLESWFIKTTAVKDKLVANNKKINWIPKATGEGRFGNWLENLVDWNLSRSRFWGTPLPIWTNGDTGRNLKNVCVGKMSQLLENGWYVLNKTDGFNRKMEGLEFQIIMNNHDVEITLSEHRENTLRQYLNDGNLIKIDSEMIESPTFDLHRPYVDYIVYIDEKSDNEVYSRETDLIDVWFDSGAMPYAQWNYTGDKKTLKNRFPADFIAEGVDQTRGWFFTLHAIATMLFEEEGGIAFKNVIANGLVQDKNGNKMSKRLGNAVDPFETIDKFGPDPTRWYMISNAQPYENLKFNIDGVQETSRKFFSTFHNTYNFFALYANLDSFDFSKPYVPVAQRTESDQWILSRLNSLIKNVDESYEQYDLTNAARAIQAFVSDELSNWYVRLNRKRFWKGEYDEGKEIAYQTLCECLVKVAKIACPIAPFYFEKVYSDLNEVIKDSELSSIHHGFYPTVDASVINKELEVRMDYAQRISSLVHSIRKGESIKVRQPLSKILIPILKKEEKEAILAVENLIKTEVNIKEIEFIENSADSVLVKKIKPNFKKLGSVYGKDMKAVAALINQMTQEDIAVLEANDAFEIEVDGQKAVLTLEDVELAFQDIPGWLVANDGALTVALDITITEDLKKEGIARDVVNRVQNLRKEMGLEVQDKIKLSVEDGNDLVSEALKTNKDYICIETQALQLDFVNSLSGGSVLDMDDYNLVLKMEKI